MYHSRLATLDGVQDLGDCFDQYGPLSAFEDVHAYKNSMIISTYIYPAIIIIDIDSGKKGWRRMPQSRTQNITSSLSFKKKEGIKSRNNLRNRSDGSSAFELFLVLC